MTIQKKHTSNKINYIWVDGIKNFNKKFVVIACYT